MPPKGKAKAAARSSNHYKQVLLELSTARTTAKQALVDIRKRRRAEKQRHQRVVRKASMLGASELMEIAGLRNMTMQDLARFATEMGVADGVPAALIPAAANPGSVTTVHHDEQEDEAVDADEVIDDVPPIDMDAVLPLATEGVV